MHLSRGEERDRAQQTEHTRRESRRAGTRELAEHKPAAEHDVAGADQQAEEEQQREEVPVPLDSPHR